MAQARQRLTQLAAASSEAMTAPFAVYIWLTKGGTDPGAPYRAVIIPLLAIAVAAVAKRLAVAAVTRVGTSPPRWPLPFPIVTRGLIGAGAFIGAAWFTHLLIPESSHAVGLTSHAFTLTVIVTWIVGNLVFWIQSQVASWSQGQRSAMNVGTVALGASLALLFGGLFGLALLDAAGVSAEARLLLAYGVWFAFAALAVASQVRGAGTRERAVGRAAALPSDDVIDRLFIHFGPVLLAVYAGVVVLATAFLALFKGPETFWDGTLSLLLGLALSALLVRTHWSRAAEAAGSQDPDSPWRTLLRRGARLLYVVMFLGGLALIWHVNLFSAATGRFGEGVVRAAINIGITVTLAYLVWEVLGTALDQSVLAPVALIHGQLGEEGGGTAATRLQTFGPVLRNFLLAFVVVIAAVASLGSLGLDVAPLLAGAGVFGIAVAFGAQTLVRDIISGIFFLADDAFRLGEYIEIGNTRGTVEGISIRSLKLRHHRGPIHTIPFGEIKQLTNHSRDWVIVKLEFLLAFDTDLIKVKKIVKEISAKLEADPELASSLLAPVKSQGVRRMEPNGMVVGIKFMAKPGEQFVLRREIYQRIRDAFDHNGIQFARPEVVVVAPSGSSGASHEAMAAAALKAAHTPDPPPRPDFHR